MTRDTCREPKWASSTRSISPPSHDVEQRAGTYRRRPADLEKEYGMCRWMAWFGQPVLIEELMFKTQHGIVDQSLHARMGAEPTNGDGVGLGWYGHGDSPALYRSIAPAWSDVNLR